MTLEQRIEQLENKLKFLKSKSVEDILHNKANYVEIYKSVTLKKSYEYDLNSSIEFNANNIDNVINELGKQIYASTKTIIKWIIVAPEILNALNLNTYLIKSSTIAPFATKEGTIFTVYGDIMVYSYGVIPPNTILLGSDDGFSSDCFAILDIVNLPKIVKETKTIIL
jgi:hypothetical protein